MRGWVTGHTEMTNDLRFFEIDRVVVSIGDMGSIPIPEVFLQKDKFRKRSVRYRGSIPLLNTTTSMTFRVL